MKEESGEKGVGAVLTAGVWTSIVIMAFGVLLLILYPTSGSGVYQLPELPSALQRLDPIAVIDLGILVLIATPVIAVLSATASLARRGDLRFTIVGLLVLAALVESFVAGMAL